MRALDGVSFRAQRLDPLYFPFFNSRSRVAKCEWDRPKNRGSIPGHFIHFGECQCRTGICERLDAELSIWPPGVRRKHFRPSFYSDPLLVNRHSVGPAFRVSAFQQTKTEIRTTRDLRHVPQRSYGIGTPQPKFGPTEMSESKAKLAKNFTRTWLNRIRAVEREVWHDKGCRNLVLRIGAGPKGSKVFYWYGRANGKPTREKIGVWKSEILLDEARKKAQEISGAIAAGKPPSVTKAMRDEKTFGELFTYYMENY